MYAPTFTDDSGNNRLRMHQMSDGTVALFVYSAIDRLAAQYGDGAAWVLMSPAHLEAAYDAAPYDKLFVDRALHPGGEQS